MKKNAYDAGREDGMYLALKIVREGGLEALEKEIRFRNITEIHTSMALKELEKSSEIIKKHILYSVLNLALETNHDEFEHGKSRMQRFVNRFQFKADCLMDELVFWEDIYEENRKMGIEIKNWAFE